MSTLDDAREGMDPAIRPQDDLFGHVNGRWLETTEIPVDKGSWGSFVHLADAAEEQVRVIIEGLAEQVVAGEEGLDGDAMRIACLYASFMDEQAVEARGYEPLGPLLGAVDSLRDVRDLAAFLGEFEQIGGSGAFAVYVDVDGKNSDRTLFNVVQGGLGLPDETYYHDEKFAEVREKYVAFLTRIFELVRRPDAAADAATVMAVETRLSQGHWERAETRDVQKTYNLLTVEELHKLCPAFDWEAFIRNLGGSAETIAETCVRQPSYLEHLSAALTELPIEDWRPWLAARVVRAYAPYLSAELVETNFDFYGRTLSGTPQLRERWKRGVAVVEGSIGEAVGREYVARHFPPHSKAMMEELVGNLQRAYRESITALDWMSDETKQRAFAKLDMFRSKIGYPEKFRDYSELDFAPDDLVGNVLSANAFENRRQLAKVGAPVDRDEWLMLPQTVNAYYRPGMNEICFPAAILQKPFFSPDAEMAENYGGIGAVIGHEIGHGFDDQGAQYDELGALKNWWTDDDLKKFKDRGACVAKQFDGYCIEPGVHHNGRLVLGESIGDLGGAKLAFKAFQKSMEGKPRPASVNGFTPEQQFFIAWGQWRGDAVRIETQRVMVQSDPHPIGKFRVNGPLSNLPEFQKAFSCKAGSAMVRAEDRCEVW
jgi:endothelin-converting enzyme/putative endopeptidase